MEFIDEFDRVEVVSDLHLGGDSDSRIFNASEELKAFIDDLTQISGNQKTALVINGDFVDFLAGSNARHFNPDRAVEILKGITSDKEYVPVWNSLRNFVAKEGKKLIIILGNHDLELALPWVQEWLIDYLSEQKDVNRSRIRFITHKGGYLCRVGKAKVLCVHGNEIDAWNVTNYKALSDITSDIIQGRKPKKWLPNAGSRLVIEIMNEVKKTYPFIDVFKPETRGAVLALLILEPKYMKDIDKFLSSFVRQGVDSLMMKFGLLGEENPSLDAEVVGELGISNDLMDDQLLMSEVEFAFRDGKTPTDLVSEVYDDDERYLGYIEGFKNLLPWRVSRKKAFREFMEPLRKDTSFELADRDETFRKMDRKVGSDISFLITGHTHLRRCIQRESGRGVYFNTGTWVRLLKLEEKVLNDETQMEQIFELFRAGKLEALEKENWILKQRTIASVVREENRTVGTLKNMELKNGKPVYQTLGSHTHRS